MTTRRLGKFCVLTIKVAFLCFSLGCAVWFVLGLGEKPLLVNVDGFSKSVYDSEGRLLRLTLSSDEKYRLWVPLERISPHLIEATLLNEDRYFYLHPGVNPVSLMRAAIQTYCIGGRRMGASTLTMQLARIRFGINSRTIGGKLRQILYAMILERHYPKEAILEAYLNMVSYGGNIEGIGAASLIYFGKAAKQLGLAQSLTLAVIPQNPRLRAPDRAKNVRNDSRGLLAARKRLLTRWQEESEAAKQVYSEFELPFQAGKRDELPFIAGHFVHRVLDAEGRGLHRSNHGRIRTTLDLDLQRIMKNSLKSYVVHRRQEGIKNASAMLVDYRTMEVKALVGSADYFNAEIQGQVDGTRARRSPGSALKPFIYGLAIDQEIIHPQSIVKDTPRSFSAYDPENADGMFAGPLSASDALVRSRNIPAIVLANQLDSPDLYGFLEKAAIKKMREKEHYGLAIVLGGVEVTMEELARLYAMLGNQGVLQPLKYVADSPATWRKRMLSREASFLVLEMLKRNPRPGLSLADNWGQTVSNVSWKTGTSYGYRDAWAAGVFGPYVLVVWVGNFDGRGDPVFTGRDGAGPLFFEVVDAISGQHDFPRHYFQAGKFNLKKVKVCAVSGKLPGKHCQHLRHTWFIPGKSPIGQCDIHREVLIDRRSGLRACPEVSGETEAEVFEFWPSDLLELFEKAGLPRRVPPPFDPRCQMMASSVSGASPEITSPQVKVIYHLRSEQMDKDLLPLAAVSDADSEDLYWFVDKKFVGISRGSKPLFWHARPGSYTVRVLDRYGRSSSRGLKVMLAD